MHQALVSPMTTNDASLPGARSGRRTRWTVSSGIEALRHEAARLRAAAQAKLTLAGTLAMPRNPTDLLQQAAMLDRGADVLALTNWN